MPKALEDNQKTVTSQISESKKEAQNILGAAYNNKIPGPEPKWVVCRT